MNRQQRRRAKAQRAQRQRLEDAQQAKRQESAAAFARRVAEGEARGCLVCRRSDGGFLRPEHPIAESLGNRDITLPNGIVCDRCNHGVCSDLDQALAEFFPISMTRAILGVETKAGKLPLARFSGGTIGMTEPGHLLMKTNSERSFEVLERYHLGGGVVADRFRTTVTGQRMTPRRASQVSRALLKATLGCAWLDHGEDILDRKYDHVRAAILGEDRRGYLMVARQGFPPDETPLELIYRPQQDADGVFFVSVVLGYFGVLIGTDSLHSAPLIDIPDELAIITTF